MKIRTSHFIVHAILLLGAIYSAFPFIWMVWTSLRSSGEAFNTGTVSLLEHWDALSNYRQALFDTPLIKFMANGVVVCSGILLFQVLTAVPSAYALAKLNFRGKRLFVGTLLVCFAIPFQSLALPLFVALSQMKALNSYFSLIFPFVGSVFAILMLAQFLRSYPDEILEAARLDGMSEFAILLRLIFPASWPAIATFSLFSVSSHWNDLYWPLIVITSPDLAPPTLGILFFRSDESGDKMGPLMAAATMVMLPLFVFFLVAQRRFVQGITNTGVK
ncbi:carbohydrate ABC transporter permease [Rhizobium tubonense]|uniref:Sugar ABC transporter permease n=1 Tax=Rhizobium tubonense TaxID=484088 RepID=A0A2W4CJ44_9HYPH|nr:carbohydrate ABC transporter permease [Rhizobium tubonense]PZM12959.1 sugar ABC transporter permease [Rhizobium tubonense]